MWDLKNKKVYLGIGVTDMRKAIGTLSVLVAQRHEKELFYGDLFVFCNRSRSLVKILYWDRNGFCLWQKRLEKEKFHWPESEDEVAEISIHELEWLLEGFDIKKAHKRLNYEVLF